MLIALLLATTPLETVVTERAPSRCVAAIALRDHVPLEQKLGTQAFTVPHLAAAYDAHVYISADENNDGRAELLEALRVMKKERCVVDLLFLAHGNNFVSWLRELPVTERPRVRLVYDTGGGSAQYAHAWIDEGVRAFVGHPSSNMAPVFYAFFLPSWLDGVPLDDAVARSNKKTYATLKALQSLPGGLLGGEDEIERLWAGTRAVVAGDAHALHRK